MGTGHDLGTWPSELDGASASGTVRTGTGTVPATVGVGFGVVAALCAILQNNKMR